MSTIRLNNDIKQKIVDQLIHHRFQEEYDGLVARGFHMAKKVLFDVFPKKDRDLMESLPEGWLNSDCGVYIKCSFGFLRLYFNGQFRVDGLAQPTEHLHYRMPNNKRSGALKVYNSGEEINDEIHALELAKMDFEERVRQIRHQAYAALNSVTTVGALIKAWPEIAPFCPQNEATAGLPAIPTNQLNELFNLPVKE